MWKAEILEEKTEEGFYIIRATFGFVDGKKQTKDTIVTSGKNVGKKNETTILEQSKIKLEQMYQEKIKKSSMVLDIKDWVKPNRPMLSSSYKKRQKHLKDVKGWLIDRKLNGIRSYTYSNGSIQSKSGEPLVPFQHIFNEHQKSFSFGHEVYGEIHLDGEMYLHGMPLEEINSLVTKEKDKDRSINTLLEYHIYNCFFPKYPDLPAYLRYNILLELFEKYKDILKYIILSEKEEIPNDSEIIIEKSLTYIKEKYEGGMLLDINSPYIHSMKITDRTDYSIKVKFMEDEEFFILDIIENENEPGIPKFIIDLKNGNICECVLSGEKELAKIYWNERHKYIKKAWLTVQYQDWTKYGKLSFPVGLYIREGSTDLNNNFIPKY